MKYRTHSRYLCLALLVSVLPTQATASESLQALLERTGKTIAAFTDQFSEVTCTELVTQSKLNKNGKTDYQEESSFDLLVTLNAAAGDLTLEESRLPIRVAKRTKQVPLLVSNGFSTLLLVFHPYYQRHFEFALLDEVTPGKPVRVSFRHLKNTPSPSALLLRGREYPLDLAGTAWIDPQAATISRVTAELAGGMEDVGLRVFQSDVQYAPVMLPGLSQPYWLPETAAIDVETLRQHWKNLHRFTRYKRFSVSTDSSTP